MVSHLQNLLVYILGEFDSPQIIMALTKVLQTTQEKLSRIALETFDASKTISRSDPHKFRVDKTVKLSGMLRCLRQIMTQKVVYLALIDGLIHI